MGGLQAAHEPDYSHTQKAPLCLILYGSALACFVLAWIIGDTSDIFIVGSVGMLIAVLAPAFHHLTVVDRGEGLAIRFGPIPLFHRTVPYGKIEKVDVGRTMILDGWGIHMSIRGRLSVESMGPRLRRRPVEEGRAEDRNGRRRELGPVSGRKNRGTGKMNQCSLSLKGTELAEPEIIQIRSVQCKQDEVAGFARVT